MTEPLQLYSGAVSRLTAIAETLDAGEAWQRKTVEFDASGRPIGLTVVDMPYRPAELIREAEELLPLLPKRGTAEEMLRSLHAQRAFHRSALPHLDLADPRREAAVTRLAEVVAGADRLVHFDPNAIEPDPDPTA